MNPPSKIQNPTSAAGQFPIPHFEFCPSYPQQRLRRQSNIQNSQLITPCMPEYLKIAAKAVEKP
jgi:hypothetical protein